MRVLVGCECSGVVRRAFRSLGHDAWSCDILPADDGAPHHLQADVRSVLGDGWDLGIFHPPCTMLANSGVRWLYGGKGSTPDAARWERMREAAEFFLELYRAPIPAVVVENPIPHRHAALPPYTQVVQPWMFGDFETKQTCLWLRGVTSLVPMYPTADACRVALGLPEGARPFARVHRMPPSADRGKLRSVTYGGIAAAMAAQFGASATVAENATSP